MKLPAHEDFRAPEFTHHPSTYVEGYPASAPALPVSLAATVFLPLFFLADVEGRLLQPLGLAYLIALFASLIVALTVTPVLSYWLLPNAPFMRREGDSIRQKALQEAQHIVESANARIERTIREVWPDHLEETALTIAWRESRYNPDAQSQCCSGLFQRARIASSLPSTSSARRSTPVSSSRVERSGIPSCNSSVRVRPFPPGKGDLVCRDRRSGPCRRERVGGRRSRTRTPP